MATYLVTGGSGFFGCILKQTLLERGHTVVNVDIVSDPDTHPNLIFERCDIRNLQALSAIFERYQFSAVFHLAAALAHAVKDKQFLWETNVSGTKNVAELSQKYKINKLVFVSSNCLWGNPLGRDVLETDTPAPVEIYGRSKWEAEKILEAFPNVVIFRCPTIIDEGRLGLLGILFEFINENRKVWVVGGGENKYQFIYAKDLADACLKALDYPKFDIFNIGSDDVKSFREVYNYVIAHAGSKSRVASLPKAPTLLAMRIAHLLKLSPLGPYQYKMIAESFVFDTSKIKAALNWKPTVTNEEMLLKSYQYYSRNLANISQRTNEHDVSAHRQVATLGVIRLLKWLS